MSEFFFFFSHLFGVVPRGCCVSYLVEICFARMFGRVAFVSIVLALVSSRQNPSRQSSSAEWAMVGHDAQHTSISPVPGQCMGATRMSFSLDESNSTILQHYASPLVTSQSTVIVGVRTDSTGLHSVRAVSADGTFLWSISSGYQLPPIESAWAMFYQPVLVGPPGASQRIYFAASAGAVGWRDNLDQVAPISSGWISTEAPFRNTSTFVNSALVTDGKGVFFTTRNTISGAQSHLVRVDIATGFVLSVEAQALAGTFSSFPNMVAPAFSLTKDLMYLTVTDDFRHVVLVALNPDTLAVMYSRAPNDPRTLSSLCLATDDSSASPVVGPDGDVYYGMIGAQLPGDSLPRLVGWLLHYTRRLEASAGFYGGFGWDDTPTIVAPSAVKNYNGTSSYLLFMKQNSYTDIGGNGAHRLVILDPFDFEADSVGTAVPVMKVVLSILSPTLAPTNSFPNARTEW
jgi:hypothetical protein